MLPPSAQELNARAALTQRLALPLVIVFCAGTVLTQAHGETSQTMTVLCVATTTFTLLLHRALRKGWLAAHAPDALLLTASLGLLALLLPSGGARSPMLLLAPLLPVIGALAGGARLCLLTTALWLVTTAVMAFIAPPESSELHLANGWLALGLLAGAACGLQAERVITELRQQIHRLTSIDPQTGLLNERGFADAASRELARAARHGSPLCLLAIYVDQDELSPDRQTERLARLARQLKSCLRAGQDLVSRDGAYSFLVLLSDTDEPAAAAVAARVQRTLRCSDLQPLGDADALQTQVGLSAFQPSSHNGLSASQADPMLHALIATARQSSG